MSDTFATFFAQVTNAAASAATDAAAPAASGRPVWIPFVYYALFAVIIYFAFFRPQSQAKKKQDAILKAAKTGDRIITTSGIHGVITNVKDTTVIVKVADNVKLEIEKTHIDKINRPEPADAEKAVAAKA